MDMPPDSLQEFDVQRGGALLISGALLVLLHFVLPIVAPFAVAAYDIYRFTLRQVQEGIVALAVAVLLWFAREPLGWLLWLVAALMAGLGFFYFIRGILAARRV